MSAVKMDIIQAYKFIKQPEKCSLAVRLECHQAILSKPWSVGERSLQIQQSFAIVDICAALQMLLGDRAE